jgi:cell division protease FtsH
MRMAASRDGTFAFLRSNARMAHKEKPAVTFEDVAGVDEAKEELQETVEFLKNPERFQRIGGRIPRGVLLVGHPGTGKTLLAKAVAGEANVPFFSLCGSDFVEMFVGVGAARVRDLFERAGDNQPCIIFLDEIDAVGRKRGTGLGGGHDEREQTLNAILSEMDGFNREDGIIVIAATNRPDVLDPALLRPGRFDREVVVDLPDLKGREAILKVHARRIKLMPNVDLGVIARGTPGASGADLEAVINESALLAASRNKNAVELTDLEESRDKVRFGRQKKSRVMSEEDRAMTAYHESGHALIAVLNPDVEPLHKVTIIPRGISLGMTMILPEKDKYGLRKRECMGILVLNMAGRVAEELFCHDVSSGAKDDIENATKLARKMVTQWGMSEKLGPVSYSDEEDHVFLGSEITRSRRHGEQISQQIDDEVRSLLGTAYAEATRMCKEHAQKLEALAKALLRMETLTSDEVKEIFAGKSIEEMMAAREAQAAPLPAAESGARKPSDGPSAGDLPAPAGSPA